jgi:hypothetical protein
MLGGRGASVVTNTVTLTNAGNQIQWTQSAGGTVCEWVGPRTPSGGFTLSGNITFNCWASESNANDNATISARVYRRTSGGTETEVTGGPFSFTTELTTTLAAKNWTGTPGASVAFSEDDRVVVRFYADEVGAGAMTAGTAAFTTNGATAAASGDSYIELTETVDWKTETITKTVKTAAGDYSLLSTWEAALQSDLVTDDVIAQAECYAGAYTDAVDITGWTTGSANYIRIYTPTAERHDGTARDVSGTGCQFTHSTSHIVTLREDYVRLEGLDLKQTNSAGSCILNVSGTITAAANETQITACVLQNTSSTAYVVALGNDADAIATLINNIVYNAASTGGGINIDGIATAYLAHNTVYSAGGTGIRWGTGVGDTHELWNNFAASGSGSAFFVSGTAGTETGGYNASDDATGDDGGLTTGAVINLTTADQFVSLTGGSEDFHLKSASDLEAVGTPLGAVTTDIDADARDGTTPDIGADEFEAGATEVTATATAIGVATVTKQVGKITDADATGVVATAKQTGKPIGATAVGVSSTTNQTGHSVHADATGVSSDTKQVGKIVGATADGVESVTVAEVSLVTAAATAVGVASVTLLFIAAPAAAPAADTTKAEPLLVNPGQWIKA